MNADGLLPQDRFFINPYLLPNKDERATLSIFGTGISERPSGRPAVVNFNGYTICFLPRFLKDKVSEGDRLRSNVVAYASHPVGNKPFGNFNTFPFAQGAQAHDGIPVYNEVELHTSGGADANFAESTMVAAATFKGTIWLAIGGNSLGVYDQPNHAIFDIYRYDADPNDPAYPFNGSFARVDRKEFNTNIRSIALASMSILNPEKNPDGTTKSYTPLSKLVLFAASVTDAANPVVALPSSDGKFSTVTPVALTGGLKPGADLSAVTTVDAKNTPMIALAWSVTPPNHPQDGMGISFFNGTTFSGNAPTLSGSKSDSSFGPNDVPIPQCIRLAVGTVTNSGVAGNCLQVFGRVQSRIVRWQYQIKRENGGGNWAVEDILKPSILPLTSNTAFPDDFTAFTMTAPGMHQGGVLDPANPSQRGPDVKYYKSTVGVMTWQISGDIGALGANLYPSNELIPYGVLQTHPERGLQPFILSTDLSLAAPDTSDSWMMVGAIHGVPPTNVSVDAATGLFTANGGQVSYFNETSRTISISNTYSSSVSLGYDGEPIEHILEVEDIYKNEIAETAATTTTKTSQFSTDFYAEGAPINKGILLFQVPTMQGAVYRVCNALEQPIVFNEFTKTPTDAPLYSDIYVGTVTGVSLSPRYYNLTNPAVDLSTVTDQHSRVYSAGMDAKPATNDLLGWRNIEVNSAGTHDYAPISHFNTLQIDVGPSSQATDTETWASSTTKEKRTTVSVDIKHTLFGIVTGLGTSTSNTFSSSYATSTALTTKVGYATELNRVTSYTVQPYLFQCNDVVDSLKNSGFVPTQYQSQGFLPFLLTYKINSISTRPQATPPGPAVTLHPEAKTVNLGSNVILSVAGRSATPITYQWYFKGKALAGQTERTLRLPGVTAAQAGNYYAKLNNAYGATTSQAALLTVLGAPTFVGKMTSGNVAPDQNIIFTSQAVGVEPMAYQWYVDGWPVKGATTSRYNLPAARITPIGTEVAVQVGNQYGKATDTTTVTADPNAPRVISGSNLFAGDAVSPSGYQGIPLGRNIYDLVLLQGKAVTAKAKRGHVTRIPFVDPKGYVNIVEFWGAGTVTVQVPNGVVIPAGDQRHPELNYTRGLADVVVSDGDASTYVSIFPLGPLPNQIDPGALIAGPATGLTTTLRSLQALDTIALGGIDASNAQFSGSRGNVGILARNLQQARYVHIGDLNASGGAVANLLFAPDASIRVTSDGDLGQANTGLILTQGVGGISFAPSLSANGVLRAAPQNKGTYLDAVSNQVTALAR